jgi:hypothetical protein
MEEKGRDCEDPEGVIASTVIADDKGAINNIYDDKGAICDDVALYLLIADPPP